MKPVRREPGTSRSFPRPSAVSQMKVNSYWKNYLFLQALAVAQEPFGKLMAGHDPPSGTYWRAVLPGRRTENPNLCIKT